jgi:hypothetical protein
MNTETTAPTEQQSAAPSARPEDRLTIRVQAGFIIDPPLWATQPSAKNWAAVVELNGHRPGGLDRRFLKTGRGILRYSTYLVRNGDVIEFAADTASRQERLYVVLDGYEPEQMRVRRFENLSDAFAYSKRVKVADEERRMKVWADEQAAREKREADRKAALAIAKAARAAMAPGTAPLHRKKAVLVGRIERLERELKTARDELASVDQMLAASPPKVGES